ncbi:ALQxL family class IV lanthipeptide [Microtetraspora glauca]|uniref:ALQxL family class IV lanthipeptide n=1 Tax=Microtetraspora glauca TaxID=1996 RepID=A0ABV3G9R2_MICGL
MELDVTALDMLPASQEVGLYPCAVTCSENTRCGDHGTVL